MCQRKAGDYYMIISSDYNYDAASAICSVHFMA